MWYLVDYEHAKCVETDEVRSIVDLPRENILGMSATRNVIFSKADAMFMNYVDIKVIHSHGQYKTPSEVWKAYWHGNGVVTQYKKGQLIPMSLLSLITIYGETNIRWLQMFSYFETFDIVEITVSPEADLLLTKAKLLRGRNVVLH